MKPKILIQLSAVALMGYVSSSLAQSIAQNSPQPKDNPNINAAPQQGSLKQPASSQAALVKVPIPRQGAYLGAVTNMKFTDFEQLIHKPLAIRSFPFTDNNNFSAGDATSDTTLGALLRANSDHNLFPLVAFYHTNRTLSEILTNTINPKDQRAASTTLPDDFARAWARGLKAYGKPVFFRWNHEMNGNWITYCTDGKSAKSFDRDTGVKQKPEDYVAAWRHVHDIFVQEGASNVSWIWCVAAANPASYAKLYPGDDYVDWTCIDGYNWSPPNPRWQTFTELFTAPYNAILKIAPSKPMMIGEFNSTAGRAPDGSQKAAWLTKAAADIPAKFPNLKAVMLFDVNAAGEYDWRIENYPAAVNAFGSAFSKDYFLSSPP